MMRVTPLGERVLLKQEEAETKTAGGIYLPEGAKEERKEATVVAAGTFADGKALPLAVGDRVLYGGYSKEEIELDGEPHLLIEYKDILAKIDR